MKFIPLIEHTRSKLAEIVHPGAIAVVNASVSQQEAMAIKVISGHMHALYAAAVVALDQLGWLNAQQREALKPWAPQPTLNARGVQTGEMRAVFTL